MNKVEESTHQRGVAIMSRKRVARSAVSLLAVLLALGCTDSNDPSSDPPTPATERVSVASDGSQADSHSVTPSFSADGRYVAFESYAANLVAGDTNNAEDIFVHDRVTGETTRVSMASDGGQADGYSYTPSISAEGRYVAFESDASNLVAGDTTNWRDVFVHDRATGETTRVSVAGDGSQGDYNSDLPSISADGRHVAFASDAGNLVAGDTNASMDIFVRSR
jgi:Tol biopolymer transport system component